MMKARPHNRTATRPDAKRRGVETLEVTLALPVLLIATLAVFEFGFITLVQQAVTTAGVEGAREAAKEQSTTQAAASEVQRILAIHGLAFDTSDTNASDDVRVLVERYNAATTQVGNASLPCSATGPALQPNQVRVTVCVRMTNDNNRPIPDWLKHLGFTLAGRTFEISALAYVE